MTYSIIQVVTNNYDKIYDCLDTTAEHRLLFTDISQPVNNWEQHIISASKQTPWEDVFHYRWHPFEYVNSDYVIWVDGSIRITASLQDLINQMEAGNYEFATIRHPHRNNIWDEYMEWIRIRNYPYQKAFYWMSYMEHNGWNPNNPGLYQVNVCVFKNTPIVKQFCNDVWQLLHLNNKNSAERLDQTLVTYILKRQYESKIKVLPLNEDIYTKNTPLVFHGVHPNI